MAAGSASKLCAATGGSLAAACCLMLMFLGAWTCDFALLTIGSLPAGYISIRGLSLAAYLLTFLIVCVGLRGSTHPKSSSLARLIAVLRFGLAVGAALLIVGAAGVTLLPAEGITGAVFAFLVKSVGPTLSIAVLLLFAAQPADKASKAAAMAMTLAFLAECGLRAIFDMLPQPSMAALVAGTLFQLGGCCLAAVLSSTHLAALSSGDASTSSTRRSYAHLAKALACIVATALMLGYLRAGASPGNSVGVAAALAVLIAVGGCIWCLPRIDAKTLFAVAVVCVSAAFLLGPMLDLAAPGASSVLADVGTILFEIIIWIISVAIVRSCRLALRAAAGARLVAVFGHMVGALVGAVSAMAAVSMPQASQAASLAIMFVYVVLLVAVTRDLSPAAFEASTAVTSAGSPLPHATSHDDASLVPRETSFPADISTPVTSLPYGQGQAADAEYWSAPCRILADRFSLTPRETEVLEQLAQGRDLASMEEKFVLSRNTVKMHVRNVYAKLGVHGKQEVIDLVDRTRRS